MVFQAKYQIFLQKNAFSETLEPSLQLEDDIVMEGERLAIAPAMTA
jgi:hypothetical protein